jgi:class 3 adenylate cyclase
VKTTGDGIYAAFADPLDAVNATLALQLALGDPQVTNGIAFKVRCGLHLGVVEQRDGDLFGSPVNRAARIMGAAHGGGIAVAGGRRPGRPTAAAAGFAARLGGVRLRDWRRASMSISSFIRAFVRIFPRCVRSLRRPTTCPNRLRRLSGANASSPKSRN